MGGEPVPEGLGVKVFLENIRFFEAEGVFPLSL
jgi:hypothetical protein